MRKIVLLTLLLSLACSLSLSAQDELYIYQHSGVTDTLQLDDVAGIRHLRTDLSGKAHDDYVVMSVALRDETVRSYLLSGVDSVVMVRDGSRIQLTRFVGSMSNDASGKRLSRRMRRTSLEGDFMTAAGSTDGVEFFWAPDDHIYLADGRQDTLAKYNEENKMATAEFFFGGEKLEAAEIPVWYLGQSSPNPASKHVRISPDQSQSESNNTLHIGRSGDCGIATATKADGETFYRFMLDHKASYLCFLPYMGNDLGRTVLKKVTVRSDKVIAGVFSLSQEGVLTQESAPSHVVTLTTGGAAGFVIPQVASQRTSAYMVIAPQSEPTRLTCEFTVYDTLLESEGVYTKTVDLDEVAANMVYVIRANCNNYVVDLGLPVKFLNHNMGAFAPEEFGGYYAFGELDDKGKYTSENYTYNKTPAAEIAEIRLTDKDVAHMRLGLNFSIPNVLEMNMLVDSCTWTWTTINGHSGHKVTGKNGNTLFLPAASYLNDVNLGSGGNAINTRGVYRTSTLLPSGDRRNWFLDFNSGSKTVNPSGDDIWLGESIRPVVSSSLTMTDGTVVQAMTDSVSWSIGAATARLFGTQYGMESARAAVEFGFIIGTEDEVEACQGTRLVGTLASGNRKFYADFTCVAENTEYFFRAYVKTADDNINYANVKQFGNIFVDLGLPSGAKWANVNVGAVSPEQSGDYYAWAETDAKAVYNANTHRWYQSSTYILPDNLREVQATRYDPAAKKWGGAWLTPSKDDFYELMTYTTPTSVTFNGIKGYLLTSKVAGYTDKSIFVPWAGYKEGAVGDYAVRNCFVATTLKGTDNFYAWHVSHTTVSDGWYRYHGLSVRPVYKPQTASKSGRAMYVRTLPAKKFFDGTIERDTLMAVVRGYTNDGTEVGIRWWQDGQLTYTQEQLTPDDDGYIQTVIKGLTPGATYCYAPYIDSGTGQLYIGDTLTVDAVGVIDLGLSVKWVNVDLGAEKVGACGDLYSWGTTEPFRNTSSYYPATWNIKPESGYDIVANKWGQRYRLPTRDECQELIDNTTRQWVTRNGYSGYLFTSTKEGYKDRSVFIPASGYFFGEHYYNQNNNADYWTSTANGATEAWDLNFTTDIMRVHNHNKYQHGFAIRAVQDRLAYVRTEVVRRNLKGMVETDSLTGYFINSTRGNIRVGFVLGNNADITVDNAEKLEVGTVSDGYFKYEKSGLAPGTVYYYRAYAFDGNEYQYGDAVKFELVQMVDLGLPSGKLWANLDLGAGVPEDNGYYYAWGELQPKDSYTQDNYRFYQNGSYVNLGSDIGGTQFDPATINMSKLWRLPTREEFVELITNCNWQDNVVVNGITCYKASSKKNPDKFIYLPRTQLLNNVSWEYVNCGLFMASNQQANNQIEHCLYLHGGSHDAGTNNGEWRYKGMTVRPITAITDTIAAGVVAHLKTENCQWTIGDGTARLRGNLLLYGVVTDITYGFVIGTIQEVEAATPASQNLFPVASKDADGTFFLDYAYDGSPKFFRVYCKVGDNYYLGDVKGITAADLLDVEFFSDGQAFDGSAASLPVRKVGNSICTYNSDYKRNQVSVTSQSYGSTNYNFYDFDFTQNAVFRNKLADGHTVEALFMIPDAVPNNNESAAFSCYYNGGSGVGVKNQKLYATFFLDGAYRFIYSNITPVPGLYYHVTGVWNRQEHKLHLYVNGTEDATPLEVGDTFTQPGRQFFVVGGYPLNQNYANYGWNGTVTFGRVYDKPLTAGEVQLLYNKLKRQE